MSNTTVAQHAATSRVCSDSRQYIGGARIDADTMLAAARRYDRDRRTVGPQDYRMRVFENGSVYLFNTERPGLARLLSLSEIQQWAARNFGWGAQRRLRPLWQEIAALWL